MKFKVLGAFGLSFLFLIIVSVTFAEDSPEQIAAKHGITFPVSELGGCKDYSECRTFCEDPVNRETCVNFAKSKGLSDEKETKVNQGTSIMAAAKLELGCDSEASCREFCGNQANWQKCGDFAKRHQLSGGNTEDPKKAEILEKAKVELGCTSYEACMSFCHEEVNLQKCSEFAKKVGLRGGEVHSGPGGCTSQETCKTFCSDPINYEICNKYASSTGGRFHGPGGCDSEAACKTYCESHHQECGFMGQTVRYGSLQEMCYRTPNCSWADNSCECHSQGQGIPAAGYEKYCKEFPGKCAPPKEGVGINTKEEYCKKFPEKCFNKDINLHPTSYPYPNKPIYQDLNVKCSQTPGCFWTGEYCKCTSSGNVPTYDPSSKCASYGCTWTGTYCKCTAPTNNYPTPSVVTPTYSTDQTIPEYVTPTPNPASF